MVGYVKFEEYVYYGPEKSWLNLSRYNRMIQSSIDMNSESEIRKNSYGACGKI